MMQYLLLMGSFAVIGAAGLIYIYMVSLVASTAYFKCKFTYYRRLTATMMEKEG